MRCDSVPEPQSAQSCRRLKGNSGRPVDPPLVVSPVTGLATTPTCGAPPPDLERPARSPGSSG
jgi:hypothetical protein